MTDETPKKPATKRAAKPRAPKQPDAKPRAATIVRPTAEQAERKALQQEQADRAARQLDQAEQDARLKDAVLRAESQLLNDIIDEISGEIYVLRDEWAALPKGFFGRTTLDRQLVAARQDQMCKVSKQLRARAGEMLLRL